jgi:hypothetical protein
MNRTPPLIARNRKVRALLEAKTNRRWASLPRTWTDGQEFRQPAFNAGAARHQWQTARIRADEETRRERKK